MLLGIASLGLVLGVFIAARWGAGLAPSLLFVTAFLALALLLRLRGVRTAAVATVGIACLFLGLARASCSPVQPVTTAQLQALEGSQVTLRGAVVGDPERVGNAYLLRVRGDLVVSPTQAPTLSGDVLVTVRPWRELIERREDGAPRYGDVLRLQGKLAALEPFGGFDYRSYLAEQGLWGAMRTPQASLLDEGHGSPLLGALFAVRKSLARSLERSLPEPQSSVAQALLLGLRRELPADVNNAFIATGTIHILAISGQHMTILLAILLGLAYAVAGRRRWGLLTALAVLWLYTGLAGASPPVVRAAIMGTLAVWARYEGRPSTGALALAVAAAAMVAVTPSVLFSVSFQLSVASMAGLVLLAPALGAWMERRVQPLLAEGNPMRPLVRGTILALAAGAAATLFTLPMTAFYFHRLSLIGVPLTLVLLPVFPLMLVTSAAAAIAGAVWGPLGQVMGWAAWLPLTYMLKVVQVSAIPSHVSLNLANFAAIVAWGYYAILIAATVRFSRPDRPTEQSALQAAPANRTTPRRALPRLSEWTFIPRGLWDRLPKKTVAIGLLGVGLLSWAAALSAPSGNLLRVAILDVGQGSAALIVTPSGHQVLVDGGPEPRAVLRGLGQQLPFWDRTLDVIALSSPDQDHLSGLIGVLGRYRADTVLERAPGTTAAYASWQKALARNAAHRIEAVSGQTIRLGDGVVLQVLHPPERLFTGTGSDDNNNSVVLKLTYGDISFLLTGDVERIAEQLLVESGSNLRSTVLVAPHHGSRTSSSPEFLQAVSPSLVAISAGKNNRFGHPHPEALSALAAAVGNERVYITAANGDVVFATDGRRLWVQQDHQLR